MQQMLSAATAVSVPALAYEIYTEHYKGSFGDKWMWTPIALTPPLTAAGVAGIFSERAAKTWLPAFAALYAADGAIGIWTHLRGVARRPGLPILFARRRSGKDDSKITQRDYRIADASRHVRAARRFLDSVS